MSAEVRRGVRPGALAVRGPRGVGRAEVAAVIVIMLVAVFLRVHRLAELPPGLHQDEGVYGLHSFGVADGQLRIYFGEREPLFMYLVAAASLLLGPTAFTLRLTAALVGVLAVFTTYLAARSMFGRSVGLFAGATMATALWPTMISRLGFRAGTLPLLETLSLYLLWEGQKRGCRRRVALGGLLLGATLYTYIASRFFPVVIVVFLIGQLALNRAQVRRALPGLSLALGAAALAFAPLGYYYVRHPEAFFGRPSQVTAVDAQLVSAASLRELAANAARTAGMFFTAGDSNWRHNLPGEPALLLPVALLMLLGYALALARPRRPARLFLAVWLPTMLVPTVLSVDAPHYLRTIGAAPAAAISAALGLAALADRVALALRRSRLARLESAVGALALALALAPGVTTYRSYHEVWASRPETWQAFNAGLAAAGQHLAGSDLWRSGAGSVYVSDRFYADRASMTLFLWPLLGAAERRAWSESDLRLKWFREDEALPVPAEGEALYLVNASPEGVGARDRLAAAGLVGEVVTLPPLGLPAYGRYHLGPDPRPGPAVGLAARGQSGLDLAGYTLGEPAKAGEAATLALYWSVVGPAPKTPPSIFSHLVNPAGRTLAQSDQVLGYKPRHWTVGETVVTWHHLPIPPGTPPGDYAAEVGLYDKESGRRQSLRVADRVDSKVRIEGLRVERGAASADAVPPSAVGRAQIAPEVLLLGADLPSRRSEPGARLPLTLYWQTTSRARDYQIELGLRSADGRLYGATRSRPVGGRYPFDAWEPGELVRDDGLFRVEPATPTGQHLLVLRALDEDGVEVGRAELGTVEVAGQPRQLDPPSPRHSLRAAFGEVADLVGYDLEAAPVKPGGKVKLILYWRSVQETATAYTVFTHLLDEKESLRGQQDSQPARGARPTTGWLPGEYVVDEYELPVAADATDGPHRVEVGMYDPQTGQRLPIQDEGGNPLGDRLLLAPALEVRP